MASKTEVTPSEEEMLEKEGPETPPDSPLIDRSNASVKALVRTAKKRGYVTHEQINSLMKEVNSEQIEDVLAMLNEMGINVIDLEATYAGPDAKGVAALPAVDGAVGGVPGAVGAVAQPQTVATAPSAATLFRPKPHAVPGEEKNGEPPEGELDDDDLEGSMPLVAIEAKLKPKVLETFDNVANSYKRTSLKSRQES